MYNITTIPSNTLCESKKRIEYIKSFLCDLDIKENSKETYNRAIRQFFSFFSNANNNYLQREDILTYKNFLKNSGYTAHTITSYLVAVRKFFEWTESKKLYPNIARSIKGMKKPNGFRKECLTTEQIKEILQGMKYTTLQEKRDFSIVNILLRTGLRTVELQRANIEDIRQEGAEAKLYIQGKGRDSKDNFVILTHASLKPLYEYLSIRRNAVESDPLFSSVSDRNNGERMTTRSISRIVKETLRRSGLNSKKLTAHSLRHTAITTALFAGATLQEVKEMARHSDINTTLIYSHNIDRIKNAPERRIDAFLNEINAGM